MLDTASLLDVIAGMIGMLSVYGGFDTVARRSPHSRAGNRYIIVGIAGVATAAALPAANVLAGHPQLLHLLYAMLAMLAAMCAHAFTVQPLTPPRQAQHMARRLAAIWAGCSAVLAAIGAGPYAVTRTMWATLLYTAVYTGFVVTVILACLLHLVRVMPIIAHPDLRFALGATTVGILGTLGVCAWTWADHLAMLATGQRILPEHGLVLLHVFSLLAVVVGVRYVSWTQRGEQLRSRAIDIRTRWRVRRAYHWLDPLWTLLAPVREGLLAHTGPAHPGLGHSPVGSAPHRSPDFGNLYGRIINILDALEALRPYIDPRIGEWAECLGRNAGLNRHQVRQLVQAAELSTALDRFTSGAAPVPVPTVARPVPFTPTLCEEARQLARMTRILRRHRLIPLLRRRASDDQLTTVHASRPNPTERYGIPDPLTEYPRSA